MTEGRSSRAHFDRELMASYPRVLGFAKKLVGNPVNAEDITQRTVEKALRSWESYAPGSNMFAWLCTIARNEFYSDCRKSRRMVEDVDGVFSSRVAVPADQITVIELEETRQRMRLLPKQMRDAVLTVGLLGYSYDDAAAIAGVACGTMKSRVSRGRAFLAGETPAAMDETEEDAGTSKDTKRTIRSMYEGGAGVSEICAATGLDRAAIMAAITDMSLRRLEPAA